MGDNDSNHVIDKREKLELARRLYRIRAKLLKDYPFFGELVMHINFSVARCETACTDMKRILVDPDFAAILSDEELSFVIMHEIMHCVLKHPARGKGLVQIIYNIACDIVVNSNILGCMRLKDFEVAGSSAMHLAPSGREGRTMSAEEVYQELISSGKYDDVTAFMDSHDIWGLVEEDDPESDKWDALGEKFGNKLYTTASLPQSIRDILDDAMSRAKLKWKELLQDFITKNVYQTDYTFAPPDRRYTGMGDIDGLGEFFMPGENPYEVDAIQNIWVVIDTSGSISPSELTQACGETQNIVNEIEYCRGMYSYFDTTVTKPVEFGTEIKADWVKPTGGGGTSFHVIFDYMREHMQDQLPNAVIIITDGYAPHCNERMAMGVPVMWILIDNPEDMPWGTTVHIESEE